MEQQAMVTELQGMALLGKFPVARMVYSVDYDVHEYWSYGSPRPKRILGRSSADAEFDLYVGDLDITYNELADLMRRQFEKNVSRYLGPAAACPSCGTHWLPGTHFCLNCGAATGWVPSAIEYTGISAYVTDISMDLAWDGPAKLHVGVRYTEVPATWGSALVGCFDDRPGDWLCGMCGCYVSGYTSKCHGCGGNRMGIAELHELVRECIYCGKQTRGGFACPECNQRLARASRLKSGTAKDRNSIRAIL